MLPTVILSVLVEKELVPLCLSLCPPRLNLSPSPSQHGAVSRTHVQATRRLRGKKRKLGSRSSGGSGYRITQQASARGSVSIDEIDPEGNYVKLRNNSETVGPFLMKHSSP